MADDSFADLSGRQSGVPPSGPPPPPPGRPPTPPAWAPQTPRSSTSGLAVAALIVGIVALLSGLSVLLFFVAFPAGVVAIVLGILALRSTRESGQGGRGLAIAGLVCGAVGTLISAVIVVFIVLLAGSLSEPDLIERDEAAEGDFTIADQDCYISSGRRSSNSGIRSSDRAHTNGRIVNTSGESSAFVVHVTFRNQDGDVLAEDDDNVATLDDGDSDRWNVTESVGRSSGVTSGELECEVSRVNFADEVED